MEDRPSQPEVPQADQQEQSEKPDIYQDPIEKNQFKRAWEKLFGDIANTVEVSPDTYKADVSNLEQPGPPEDIDTTLQRSIEAAEHDEPIEKLNELRQEVKDAPSPVQGASSVGRVMAEALTQRQENISPSLATTEGLHRTMTQQAITNKSTQSMYKKAIIYGIAAGVTVLLLVILYISMR